MGQCRVNTVSEILTCQMGDSPPIWIADPIVEQIGERVGCVSAKDVCLNKSLLSAKLYF